DQVARLIELRGGGQAGRAGAYYGHPLASAVLGRVGLNPTHLKALVDDRALDVLDRHRRLDDAQHARAFARRGAYAARELGEVVRQVQTVQGFAPAAAVHQIVPLGNQVIDRAAGVTLAVGHAAIHATRALLAQMFLRHDDQELV